MLAGDVGGVEVDLFAALFDLQPAAAIKKNTVLSVVGMQVVDLDLQVPGIQAPRKTPSASPRLRTLPGKNNRP
jgi:hypothetical protein